MHTSLTLQHSIKCHQRTTTAEDDQTQKRERVRPSDYEHKCDDTECQSQKRLSPFATSPIEQLLFVLSRGLWLIRLAPVLLPLCALAFLALLKPVEH